MNLDFQKSDGLITAVIQDHVTGRVLMVGYMNEEAFRLTVETGFATFYSRSRRKLWLKGESSGHRLVVKEISTDCDLDAVLVKVEALGPGVCHEGYQSCFFRRLENGQWTVTDPKTYDPAAVYQTPVDEKLTVGADCLVGHALACPADLCEDRRQTDVRQAILPAGGLSSPPSGLKGRLQPEAEPSAVPTDHEPLQSRDRTRALASEGADPASAETPALSGAPK